MKLVPTSKVASSSSGPGGGQMVSAYQQRPGASLIIMHTGNWFVLVADLVRLIRAASVACGQKWPHLNE